MVTACMIVIFTEVFSLSKSIAQMPYDSEKDKKIIVIDPGHGGHDKGTVGNSGLMEKDITLTISKLISNEMKDRFTVILTRTDDYSIDLSERTAFANHHKANLFVSIHTNGSYILKKNGITISYFEKQTKNENLEKLTIGKQNINSPTQWEDIQDNQTSKSREFAQAMTKYLPGTISILKAPVYVLSGAGMPSILIEIGYLTNPSDENKLNNIKYLNTISQNICSGIENFLK